MKSRARYSFHQIGHMVIICDLCFQGVPSVTNDIERVLRDLQQFGIDLDEKLVIYRDSGGCWDGVATAQRDFHDFVPLRATTLEQAESAARRLWARGAWPGVSGHD